MKGVIYAGHVAGEERRDMYKKHEVNRHLGKQRNRLSDSVLDFKKAVCEDMNCI
jgi:hypothetical protein